MQSLKILMKLKICHSILCIKHWKILNKKIISLKNVAPRTKANEDKKKEVLNNVEDLYNELYYIYKDKYNEENLIWIKKTKKIWLQKIKTYW